MANVVLFNVSLPLPCMAYLAERALPPPFLWRGGRQNVPCRMFAGVARCTCVTRHENVLDVSLRHQRLSVEIALTTSWLYRHSDSELSNNSPPPFRSHSDERILRETTSDQSDHPTVLH